MQPQTADLELSMASVSLKFSILELLGIDGAVGTTCSSTDKGSSVMSFIARSLPGKILRISYMLRSSLAVDNVVSRTSRRQRKTP